MPDPSPSKPSGLYNFVLLTYALAIVISLPLIVVTLFVFDSTTDMWVRQGAFFSALLLPVGFGLALLLQRYSRYWLILPALPVISLIVFGDALDQVLADNNREFCEHFATHPDPRLFESTTDESVVQSIVTYCEKYQR